MSRGTRIAGSSVTRTGMLAIALAVMLAAFALLDLAWAGSYSLGLGQVWDALTGNGTWATENIVVHQNLPRTIGAVAVGAGLAVTGCTMQAVFKNPLADPYILGLSSGASLGSALAIMLLPAAALSVAQPVLAALMCLATTFLVYAVSRFGGTAVRTETLVLAGVAISCLFSAIVSFMTYIAPSDKMQSIVFWSLGSLSGVGTDELLVVVPAVAVGIALMLTQGRHLNAMMIGDSHAMDLGVDVRRVRIGLLVVSSLVVAACVAFVGTIGFVGLVIPHILRMVLGPDNRLILPMSALGGGVFLLVCDWASHAVSPFYGVIPIGIITALVGGPFFIYLLCRRNREVGW